MSPLGLLICTTCFGLTSAGWGTQRCHCEKYQEYPGVDCPSGYHLCYMCAATVAGGTGRYSWNVCDVCLKFNRKLASDYGVSLPLGRHSIMNGLSIPMSASAEVQAHAAQKLLHFIDVAGAISDWGKLQARVLFESVPVWRREPYVKRDVWEAKFKLTGSRATTRSVDAFKGYLRVESFEGLSKIRE